MTFASCCAETGATFGTASIACRAARPTARGGSSPTRWRSLRTSRRWTSAAVATASTTSGACPRPTSPPSPTTTCATSHQTGGYLSERSAKLYDQQVEVLFIGSADAMRRQALVAIGAYVRRRRGLPLTYLDVACGTGRFMASVLD